MQVTPAPKQGWGPLILFQNLTLSPLATLKEK